MKQTGHVKNWSQYVEGRIHDDFSALFPSGRQQAIGELEETLKKARQAVREIDDVEEGRMTIINGILKDYLKRADKLGSDRNYERYQKAWLKPHLQEVTGMDGITDIDSLYGFLESRRTILMK